LYKTKDIFGFEETFANNGYQLPAAPNQQEAASMRTTGVWLGTVSLVFSWFYPDFFLKRCNSLLMVIDWFKKQIL